MHEAIATLATKALGSFALASPSISHWQTSGSFLFDQIIRGWKYREAGYPGGKFIEFYGEESAGKTALAMRAAKACQDAGGLVIYVNTAEQGFNPEWANIIGVDTLTPSKWLLVNAFALESCFQFLEDAIMDHHDSAYEILVIIDSLSGLGCIEYSMDKSKTKDGVPAASGAKFLHQWFRRGALYYLSGSKITVIAIRHLTASPRAFAPETTTHGKALNFYAWLRIKVRREDMEDSDTGLRTGMWLHLKIKKSKVGPPFGECSMPLYSNRGFDEGLELVWHLIQTGVLEKDKNGRIEWEGARRYVKEVVKLYHENTNTKKEIRDLVLATGGIQQKKKAAKKKGAE